MDWSLILHGAIGAVGVPVVLYLFGLLLSRKTTHAFGFKIGKLTSGFGQKKVGGSWDKIESRIQTTIQDFVDGVKDGLDSDDA